MADPIVHITNGIPDVGTGNITTLGLTIQPQASATAGVQGPLVQGAVTTSPPAYTTGNTNPLSLDTSGNLRTSVLNTVAVSGTFWQATQPISGTVAVSGTVTVTGSVAASQSGTWNINNIAGTITLPTGAATAAKQPLPGVAGTPSADVITVQGTASMTPLKVDNSGVTQPISGNVGITGNVNVVQVTSPWVTSISGNVTCVQSGNWTSRCVGNAGGIFDFSSVQNVATPGQAILIGAEFNAVPTTITTGNSSPLQLDNAANLLVNIKTSVLPTGAATSANQCTAAAQGSTTSGQTGHLGMGAVTTGSPAYTTGQTSPLSLDTAGNLRVNVVAGGGAGGTSSTFGSAFPATGTAIGVKDSAGTNMTFLQVNASNALKVDGSAVTQPVSGTFWQATQPVSIAAAVTVAQATAANLNATVTGTVAATQSGNWTSRIVGNAGAILDFVGQNVAAPANAILIGAEFNTTPTTITSGNASPLQLDSAGNLLVNVKAGGGAGGTSSSFGATFPATGTAAGAEYLSSPPTLTTGQMVALQTDVNGNLKVNIQAGAGSGGTASSVGGALPGQGTLAMGSVTTAAPTYTTATANSLSLTTAGALRVDGSAVTQPVSGTFWQTTQPVSGTVTANQGGAPWTTKPDGTAWAMTGTSANVNVTNASIAVTGTFWQATQPISAASLPLPTGAATAANQPTPAAIGSTTSGQQGALVFGAVTTAAPTYTTAQSDPLSLTTAGALRVDGSGATQPVSGSVSITGTATISGTVTANQGGTWTVQPGNTANTTAWLVTGTGGTFPVTGTFWQATQPVSIAAAVTVQQSTAANLNATVTGTVAATQSGTWTVQQGTPPWLVGGDVANAATDSGNPVKIGAVARTANPTAVTTGQRVNLMADKLGKLVAVGALRDVKGVQKTSISVATETTVVNAGGAGVFNDVYAIVVTNKSATGVFIDFRDATAGTVRMTLAAPASDTRGFTVPVDSAMVQAVAANNWTATVSSAVSSIEISVLYVSNL